MNTLIIAKRVIKQLQGDRRFLILFIIAPLIIIYFLIHEIIRPEYSLKTIYMDFAILTGYIFILWILASITLKETE